MIAISVNGLGVDFPVYDVRARSLRNTLLNASVGTSISKNTNDVVVVNALNNISFELESGDRLALVGHNGSGKSTLLRCLAGAYEPIRGEVCVQGKIASLFDLSLGIDPELTGFDNIMLRGMYSGLPRDVVAGKIEEIARFSELGDFLNLPLRTYSSGMQLRLAFAVSTAFEADILLADEIIGVGDAAFVQKSQERLKSRISGEGILVLASHSIEVLRQYCNQGLWLVNGEVAALGELEEVLEKYQQSAN